MSTSEPPIPAAADVTHEVADTVSMNGGAINAGSWASGGSPAASALRLAVIYQFCVGQVLLDRLAGRSIFVAALPETVLVAACLLMGVIAPFAIAALGFLMTGFVRRRWSEHAALRCEAGIAGLPLVPFLGNLLRIHLALIGPFLLLAAVAIAVAGAVLLVRVPLARRLVIWLSPVLLFAPGLYFVRVLLPIWRGVEVAETAPVARTPHPVVWIVLDEFSGVTLLDQDRQLNPHRVPRLAEFAREADWYRNATSVYPRTDQAVPAMLSGRYPRAIVPPRPEYYPGQLFQRLRETGQFEEAVFEPFTRLAGNPISRSTGLPFSEALVRTLNTLGIVWLNDAVSADPPFAIPPVPMDWYGLGRVGRPEMRETRGVMHYSWDADRVRQVDHFIRCLERGEKPALYFLHIALPHAPWLFTPSGKAVAPDDGYWFYPVAGGVGDLGEVWVNDEFVVTQQFQRYLWQVHFADRQVGRILDQLRQAGLYDESLILITGDHGAAFRPNLSRRTPAAGNLADIQWVPLFIKRPGQTQGAVQDRNVESIDLWPTVADSLGLPLSHPVDGQSLFRRESVERPMKRFHDEKQPLLVDAVFEERWPALNDFLGLMGSRDDVVPARRFQPKSALLGRAIDTCEVVPVDPPPRANLGTGQVTRFTYAPDGPSAPCWLSLDLSDAPQDPGPLVMAVALNGKIVALSRPIRSKRFRTTFTALIDESQFATGANEYRFYLVADGDPGNSSRPRLTPIRIPGVDDQ